MDKSEQVQVSDARFNFAKVTKNIHIIQYIKMNHFSSQDIRMN